MIIGVSGVRGSFSEEAARTYVKKWLKNKRFTISYLVSAENVLQAIENKEVDLGIFPIENSNGGIVIEAVYAMAKHRFKVKKIFEIDVHQNLIVKKGVKAGEIKRVASHDQGLKQCRMYLKRMWPKVKWQEYPDTAKAAADLASGVLPRSTAAVSYTHLTLPTNREV